MKRFFNTPILILLLMMVIMNILDGNFSNPLDWFINKLLILPGIIIGVTFHEFAHGMVSHLLGDPTPKIQGRLTLNPLAHFEMTGFIALLLVGFGWGAPVEIDNRYYKKPRRDEFLVSIAGVLMNLLVSIVFMLVMKVLISGGYYFLNETWGTYLIDVIKYIIMINIVLMVFNLLPIPPLDGFGILTQIFDLRKYDWYMRVYQNGLLILLVFILFNFTDRILNPCVEFIYTFLVEVII